MIMCSIGLGSKIDCADEVQQQFALADSCLSSAHHSYGHISIWSLNYITSVVDTAPSSGGRSMKCVSWRGLGESEGLKCCGLDIESASPCIPDVCEEIESCRAPSGCATLPSSLA
jgi:hypothetical protein